VRIVLMGCVPRRRLVALCAAMLAASAIAIAAFAQEEPPRPKAPPWIELTVVDVSPSMVDEFLAVERELSARAKRTKTPWRIVSRTEVFGDRYRFLIDTPLEKLAVLDKKSDPDPELESLAHRLEKCITRQETYAIRTLSEIDNPLPENEPEDLMVVNHVRVFPGREQDYMNVMTRDVLPHFNEAGAHHVTGSVALGGDSGFIHLFYVKDFAELDKGSPVVRALGPEGAQEVTKKLSGIVAQSELWLARVLPDVSYRPAPAPAKPEKP
jgi:hypothetical protein